MIIAIQSKMYSSYTPKQVSFRGYNDETHRVQSKNKMDWCIHETSFFRNIETLEFLRDKILREFPKGTQIADFGCSNGEELYSLMMLLNPKNKDGRYNGIGYDVVPKVVELAKTGPFKTKYRFIEGVIDQDYEYKTSDRKSLRDLFFDCFEKVPDDFVNNAKRLRNEELLEKEIAKENDTERLLRLKCFREIFLNKEDYSAGRVYLPKNEFRKSVDFRVGDINDLSQLVLSDKKTGVIFFKNAWYHLLGSRYTFDKSKLNIKGALNVMQMAYNALPDKGLFVVGNLENDHLYRNQPPREIRQNAKKIKIVDTYFHTMLAQSGFKPLFYEALKESTGWISKDVIYLPSVWQKVPRCLK